MTGIHSLGGEFLPKRRGKPADIKLRKKKKRKQANVDNWLTGNKHVSLWTLKTAPNVGRVFEREQQQTCAWSHKHILGCSLWL